MEKIAEMRFGIGKKELDPLVTGILGIVNEVPIELKPDGLHLRAVNAEHIALYYGTLYKEMFEVYEIDGVKDDKINVPMEVVKNIIKKMPNSAKLEMAIYRENQKEGGDTATYTIEMVIDNGKVTKRYKFSDIPSAGGFVPKVPKISHNTLFEMPSKDFYDYTLEMASVSDYYTLHVAGTDEGNEVKVRFTSGMDSDLTDKRIEIETTANKLVFDSDDEVKSAYPLEYFVKSKAISKVFDTVKVHLANDVPINLTFNTDNIELNLMVAPHVEWD